MLCLLGSANRTWSNMSIVSSRGQSPAVRPVFLHSPHRTEALIFLLMIALMIYFLLQRIYRQNTPDDAPVTEHRATAATLLKAFQGYAIIIEKIRAVESSVPRDLRRGNETFGPDSNFPRPPKRSAGGFRHRQTAARRKLTAK